MSSNHYPACVSQNLVRTSAFGYHERTVIADCVLTMATVRKLPLASTRSSSTSQWKARRPTTALKSDRNAQPLNRRNQRAAS